MASGPINRNKALPINRRSADFFSLSLRRHGGSRYGLAQRHTPQQIQFLPEMAQKPTPDLLPTRSNPAQTRANQDKPDSKATPPLG